MTSNQVFKSTSLDLCAFLVAKAHEVTIHPDLSNPRRAVFQFNENAALHRILLIMSATPRYRVNTFCACVPVFSVKRHALCGKGEGANED